MPKIRSVKWIRDITGSDTTGKWDVVGTDLGIPVYSPSAKRMYFLFGDTYGSVPEDPMAETNWRGTVAGYTDCLDFSDGVQWDGFLADERGLARELIHSHYSYTGNLEVSKISQGGVEVNGKLYVFYESINHWGPEASGYWYINYGGALRSEDGGKTFEKVYDLSWVEPTEGEKELATVKRVVEEDMNLQPSGVDFDVKAHIAPGFGQLYAADGKDGYIYLYGRYGGRISGVKVGRVRKEHFEEFGEYEYLTRFENGVPVWRKGREGLDAIMADPAAAEVIPGPTSNMAVSYNAYLQRWMLSFYLPNQGICYALAETPCGPYSTPEMLIPMKHPDLTAHMPPDGNSNSLYGGFIHEMMQRENGKIFYIVACQWYRWPGQRRYYGSRLFEAEFE